jgi:aldehyde dehydrogenase family protein
MDASFTGSTEVTCQIRRVAAEHLQQVTLELREKTAYIVLPDATCIWFESGDIAPNTCANCRKEDFV